MMQEKAETAWGFRLGDFVGRLHDGDTVCHGAIVGIDRDDELTIRYFYEGFPRDIKTDPREIPLGKIQEREMLDCLSEISAGFDEKIKEGGLPGAVAARRQHYLNWVIRAIGEGDHFYAVTIDLPEPMTGTYVLQGIYAGYGLQNHQGLIARPRLSEKTVAFVMKDLHPNGYGRISHEDYHSTRTLVGYCAFEVPENALHFVKAPVELITGMKFR